MSNSKLPKLLDQVRNLMRLRHLSRKTERAYVGYIRNYHIGGVRVLHNEDLRRGFGPASLPFALKRKYQPCR